MSVRDTTKRNEACLQKIVEVINCANWNHILKNQKEVFYKINK